MFQNFLRENEKKNDNVKMSLKGSVVSPAILFYLIVCVLGRGRQLPENSLFY